MRQVQPNSILQQGFGFVKRDIVLKLGIIREIFVEDRSDNETLQMMVEREVKNDTARNTKKQGGSRYFYISPTPLENLTCTK